MFLYYFKTENTQCTLYIIHWSTGESLLKISFIMSQCHKMAHEITVPAHSRNTTSTRGSSCDLKLPQIINVEIESPKFVLSVVETYLFRNLERKKIAHFPKFWDYLKNCTSSNFSTKKEIFFHAIDLCNGLFQSVIIVNP